MNQKMKRMIAGIRSWIISCVYAKQIHSHGRNYFQKGCLNLAKSAKFELKEKNVFDRGFDIEVSGGLILFSFV